MAKIVTTEIYVTRVDVIDKGDPSVGIFPRRWSIDGGFYFEETESMERFKQRISEAFEEVTENPEVYFV